MLKDNNIYLWNKKYCLFFCIGIFNAFAAIYYYFVTMNNITIKLNSIEIIINLSI